MKKTATILVSISIMASAVTVNAAPVLRESAPLNEFIEKIIVHALQWDNGKRTQELDIYLNFTGNFKLRILNCLYLNQPRRKSQKWKRRKKSDNKFEMQLIVIKKR